MSVDRSVDDGRALSGRTSGAREMMAGREDGAPPRAKTATVAQSQPTSQTYFSRFASDMSTIAAESAGREATSGAVGARPTAPADGARSAPASCCPTAHGRNDFVLLFDAGSGTNRVAYFPIDAAGRRKRVAPKQNLMITNKVKDITEYGVAVMDNYLYLIGGKHVMGAVLRYCHRFNPDNNQWRPLASMKVARSRHTATALEGYIYVCGGETRSGRFTDSLERFDPMTDSWTELRPMFSPRADHAAVAAQNRLFISGGLGNRTGANINFWQYDPKTDFWTQARGKSTLPKPKERHSMVYHRNKIYCIGGVTINRHYEDADDHTVVSFDCSRYNIGPKIEGIWDRSHPDLDRPRCGADAVALGHYVYVFGGRSCCSDDPEPAIDYYNINRRRWQNEFRLMGGGFANVKCCVVRVPTTNKQFSTLSLAMTKPWILW